MNLPKLNEVSQSRSFVNMFLGLNEGAVVEENEFSSMKNLTSDAYPAFSTRRKRSIYGYVPKGLELEEENGEVVLGMLEKEKLLIITGWKAGEEQYVSVFYGEEWIDGLNGLGLSYSKKTLVSMGAYVCIFPDKVWFNTATKEYGSMEAYFDMSTASMEESEAVSSMLIVRGCKEDGTLIGNYIVSDAAPDNPSDGEHWIDTSGEKAKLKEFNEASGMWIGVETYLKLSWAGIGKYFQEGETVEVLGFDSGIPDFPVKGEIVNGYHQVVRNETDCLILDAEEAIYGIAWNVEETGENCSIVVRRAVPDMDFVIECNNRIWGCKYGEADGKRLNEIYACKQGDMKSWYTFEGVSTDSYTLSVGSDGPFTGAVTYLGYPMFFKENQILRIYGSMPSEYQLAATECRGVESGSGGSLCVINGTLFYKSPEGVCAYDGSMPSDISGNLKRGYGNGIGGRFQDKYYISLERDGSRHLLVYDTKRGLWHEEDGLEVEGMVSHGSGLLLLSKGTLWSVEGTEGEPEENFEWEGITGVIGYAYPDKKYISRFNIRMRLTPESDFRIYLEYDSSGRFEFAGEVKGMRMGTYTLPVRPRRCDHMRMKLAGRGECRIFSIAKILEIGSDM